MSDTQRGIDRLLDIVAKLRGEGGCPWDREQTLESLKQYLIEESYEVIDAVDSGKLAGIGIGLSRQRLQRLLSYDRRRFVAKVR